MIDPACNSIPGNPIPDGGIPRAGLSAEQIADSFNAVFSGGCNTIMLGGASEPLFVPASGEQPARIHYTRDYARSALHEAAHWCIAGIDRRGLLDFGYAYQPPPRTQKQQQRFFLLERDTQALELLFCDAAELDFQPSPDNLDIEREMLDDFYRCVAERAGEWAKSRLPPRAIRLIDQLRWAVRKMSND